MGIYGFVIVSMKESREGERERNEGRSRRKWGFFVGNVSEGMMDLWECVI